jgi:hypothetical protein
MSPESSANDASPGCMPTATPSELASTPRTDINLELLALRLSSGRIVADQAIYDRVVRDVGAIRAGQPAVATIGFQAWTDGKGIDLSAPFATSEQMKQGEYHAWDCLNAAYGASMPFEFIKIGNAMDTFVFIKLKGIYAVDLVAKEYGRLPGVTHAEASQIGGDGPTICVSSGPSTWHYVFDAAGGDCPAGCTEHHDWHFTTEADGAVKVLEEWNSQDGTPAPTWVAQYASRSSAVCH